MSWAERLGGFQVSRSTKLQELLGDDLKLEQPSRPHELGLAHVEFLDSLLQSSHVAVLRAQELNLREKALECVYFKIKIS
jgi:hypothetical protein